MPKLPGGPEVPPITGRSVLLVEGNDEIGFFEALIKSMGLASGTDIQVWSVNGKNDYRNKFEAFLLLPGFENVKSYGLICDADDSAQNTLTSIQNMLRDAHQPCPDNHAACVYDNDKDVKVGIFIMPGYGATKGMLEDLCLQTVQNHPIMPSVEEFVLQIKQKMQSEAPKNESKAKVQVFLAGMKETVPHLGVAAGKGGVNPFYRTQRKVTFRSRVWKPLQTQQAVRIRG